MKTVTPSGRESVEGADIAKTFTVERVTESRHSDQTAQNLLSTERRRGSNESKRQEKHRKESCQTKVDFIDLSVQNEQISTAPANKSRSPRLLEDKDANTSMYSDQIDEKGPHADTKRNSMKPSMDSNLQDMTHEELIALLKNSNEADRPKVPPVRASPLGHAQWSRYKEIKTGINDFVAN